MRGPLSTHTLMLYQTIVLSWIRHDKPTLKLPQRMKSWNDFHRKDSKFYSTSPIMPFYSHAQLYFFSCLLKRNVSIFPLLKKKYILESWPLAGSFKATARPKCSVKNIQELYPTKNWQNHYKTIIIQRQKNPQRTQNKGNLLRGKKGNIILVQMKWVCCHFTKLLQDIKNITYKKKPKSHKHCLTQMTHCYC